MPVFLSSTLIAKNFSGGLLLFLSTTSISNGSNSILAQGSSGQYLLNSTAFLFSNSLKADIKSLLMCSINVMLPQP